MIVDPLSEVLCESDVVMFAVGRLEKVDVEELGHDLFQGGWRAEPKLEVGEVRLRRGPASAGHPSLPLKAPAKDGCGGRI